MDAYECVCVCVCVCVSVCVCVIVSCGIFRTYTYEHILVTIEEYCSVVKKQQRQLLNLYLISGLLIMILLDGFSDFLPSCFRICVHTYFSHSCMRMVERGQLRLIPSLCRCQILVLGPPRTQHLLC